MNLVYPKIKTQSLPLMLTISVVGAMFAGCYGMLHDEITFSISSEYFSRLKFQQFHYADFGLPQRVFVAEIGFLATWWVGFIAGWFFSRVAAPAIPPRHAFQAALRGFNLVFGFAVSFGIGGYLFGLTQSSFSNWNERLHQLGVIDVRAFVRVAYIHNAGYLGALIGFLARALHAAVLNPKD